MNFLGLVVLIVVVVFCGFQIYGLIKDFKARKKKKAEDVKINNKNNKE